MPISHFYSLTQADGTATSVVRPTDWNSAHAMAYTLTGNSIAGLNTTVSGTNIIYAGSGAVSVGGTNGSVVFSADRPISYNYFNPQDAYLQVAGQQGQASMHIQPAQIPNVIFDRIMFPCQYTGATNSTGSHTLSLAMGVYTRNASTLSLLTSWSQSFAGTHSGTVLSNTFGGVKLMDMTLSATTSLPEDQYYVGIWSRTTSGGANATWNQILASQLNSQFNGIFGINRSNTDQYTRGLGHFSATFSTALPSSVGFNQITGTASIALRQPIWYMVNGTF